MCAGCTKFLGRTYVLHVSVFLFATASFFAGADTPTYNKDIRPILAERCLHCHGQDAIARKADLRLDSFEGATAALPSGETAIVPGAPNDSALLKRILSNDPEERMPPVKSGEALSQVQIETLKRWIDAGAKYELHWAYVAPQRPSIPEVKNSSWPQNAIDYFVLARMETEGLTPAPQADRYTLLRRMSFDLTGLPPSIEEVDRFAKDPRPHALEWVADRLLKSPRYGEHFGRQWLDLARYADTNGYHIDTKRSIWPYRDWVINALNQNMPFDQFTVEQLAGDLLPNATMEQKIATGFHRNTMFNEEGGIDPEEFRTKAVVDRVGTTMTVWMGATMMCAECHEHKYDPFTQKDFYQLYAFFNNVPEVGGGTGASMAPKVILPYDDELKAKFSALDADIADVEKEREGTLTQLRAELAQQEIADWGNVFPKDVRVGVLLDSTESAFASLHALDERIAAKKKEREEEEKKAPSSLVMAEMETPRETHIHKRGDFLQPGDVVQANVPEIFPDMALEEERRATRLDLAHWLVDRNNPLTARVTVNRYWMALFGRGLVSTPEDFGTRGAAPSHPELLDWFAVEFMESGWDVKALLRLIVTSATYQQSSAVGAAEYERDPHNVLLARGPRHRLDAECIRDNVLAISGLLVEKMGGPSVFPYQPPGLWEEKVLTGYEVGLWPETTGDDLYRRGVYTFRRRSVPYPTFQGFDAPSYEYCVALRSRTNTPLQALTTLNDPQFVEAARVLAQRILTEGGADTKARIAFALRLCLARPAQDKELEYLSELYTAQHEKFAADTATAEALIKNGRANVPTGLDTIDFATWTWLANVLLNLDETMTKG